MKIIKTKIKGLVLIKTKIHADKRGFLKKLKKIILPKKNSSLIVFHFQKNTLRGLHLQKKKTSSKNYNCSTRKNFRCSC